MGPKVVARVAATPVKITASGELEDSRWTRTWRPKSTQLISVVQNRIDLRIGAEGDMALLLDTGLDDEIELDPTKTWGDYEPTYRVLDQHPHYKVRVDFRCRPGT